MQVEYKVKLGQDEFLIKVDVSSSVDFFEKLSFYSGLPKTGPNGEDDLKITHRNTTEGYNYYSLVSEKAGMEFKFGQPKESPKSLYGKGWEPLFNGAAVSDQVQTPQRRPAQAQVQATTGLQAQVVPKSPAFVNPPTQVQYVAPVPSPVQTFQQSAPQPVNPQTSAIANNVLARFNIPAKQ